MVTGLLGESTRSFRSGTVTRSGVRWGVRHFQGHGFLKDPVCAAQGRSTRSEKRRGSPRPFRARWGCRRSGVSSAPQQGACGSGGDLPSPRLGLLPPPGRGCRSSLWVSRTSGKLCPPSSQPAPSTSRARGVMRRRSHSLQAVFCVRVGGRRRRPQSSCLSRSFRSGTSTPPSPRSKSDLF